MTEREELLLLVVALIASAGTEDIDPAKLVFTAAVVQDEISKVDGEQR